MPEISKDLVSLLQYLLPGFLVAWVIYGLTSHEKPVQSERIIHQLNINPMPTYPKPPPPSPPPPPKNK